MCYKEMHENQKVTPEFLQRRLLNSYKGKYTKNRQQLKIE